MDGTRLDTERVFLGLLVCGIHLQSEEVRAVVLASHLAPRLDGFLGIGALIETCLYHTVQTLPHRMVLEIVSSIINQPL